MSVWRNAKLHHQSLTPDLARLGVFFTINQSGRPGDDAELRALGDEPEASFLMARHHRPIFRWLFQDLRYSARTTTIDQGAPGSWLRPGVLIGPKPSTTATNEALS